MFKIFIYIYIYIYISEINYKIFCKISKNKKQIKWYFLSLLRMFYLQNENNFNSIICFTFQLVNHLVFLREINYKNNHNNWFEDDKESEYNLIIFVCFKNLNLVLKLIKNYFAHLYFSNGYQVIQFMIYLGAFSKIASIFSSSSFVYFGRNSIALQQSSTC